MVEGKSVKVFSPDLKDKKLAVPEGALSSKAETVVDKKAKITEWGECIMQILPIID